MQVNWQTQMLGTILTRPAIANGETREILSDLNFSRGFQVSLFHSNSSTGRLAGVLTHGGEKAEGDPVWKLSQWGCTHNLAEAMYSRFGSILSYDDGGKKVVLNVGKTGNVSLSIEGSNEYTRDDAGNIRDRMDSAENWPHLLLEQSLNYRIADAAQLWMELEYEVTRCKSLVDRNLYPSDSALHAAQFQWFLNLMDDDPKSESFGERMWFGFSMFDSRSLNATPNEFFGYDGGKEDSTGLFIYMFSLAQAAKSRENSVSLPSSVIGGGLRRVKVNIFPLLKTGLRTAKKLGAMKGASVEKLLVASTNIGWELPGNFDAEANIANLNIYQTE